MLFPTRTGLNKRRKVTNGASVSTATHMSQPELDILSNIVPDATLPRAQLQARSAVSNYWTTAKKPLEYVTSAWRAPNTDPPLGGVLAKELRVMDERSTAAN